MSSIQFNNVPAGNQGAVGVTFQNANGTVAKLLIDGARYPAAAPTATTPLLYGGGALIDNTMVSNDTADREVMVYGGQVLTTQGAGPTGTMTTTTSTIPRTSGSFITDGFQVGDLVMTFAPYGTAPNAGVDGILCLVSAVTALGLTLVGTPIAALTLATGTRVCKMSVDLRAKVLTGAGTNGVLPSVSLLDHSNDGSIMRTERFFAVDEVMAVAMVSAVTAGYYVNISGQVAKF